MQQAFVGTRPHHGTPQPGRTILDQPDLVVPPGARIGMVNEQDRNERVLANEWDAKCRPYRQYVGRLCHRTLAVVFHVDIVDRQRAARIEQGYAVRTEIVQAPAASEGRHAAIVPCLPDRGVFPTVVDDPEADLHHIKMLADHPRRDRHHVVGIVAGQQRFGQRQLEPVVPRRRRSFERCHRLHRERLEPAALHIADPVRSRFGIEHADGADGYTFAFEHGAGIEPHALGCGDERVGGEPAVARQVGHDEDTAFGQRDPADRNVEWQFALADADLGLEPLAVVSDEIDDGDRRVEQGGGDFGDPVEHRVAIGIEDMVALERRHARSTGRIFDDVGQLH